MLQEYWSRKATTLRAITEAYLIITSHLVFMYRWYPKIKSVCVNNLTDWRRELGRRVGGMP